MTAARTRVLEGVVPQREDGSEQRSAAMILPIVVIVVIVLAFGVPGMLVSLRDRSQERDRRAPVAAPGWWAEFEREFRAYVRQLERERGDARGSHTD
jgi:hypothetical protein